VLSTEENYAWQMVVVISNFSSFTSGKRPPTILQLKNWADMSRAKTLLIQQQKSVA